MGGVLDLLHEEVHNRPQVATLAEVRPRCKGRARRVIMDESARIHDCHQSVQVDAVHERVASRNGFIELVPDILWLCHPRILQDKPGENTHDKSILCKSVNPWTGLQKSVP